MRALVTGATGYTGSRLCRHLVARGWAVDAVVRPGADLNRAGGLPGVTCHEMDDPGGDLDKILAAAAPDVVMHLAAGTPHGDDAAAVDALVDANVRLPAHLGAALTRYGRAPLLHAASWWEWDTDGRFAPANRYAATKAAGRVILETAARGAPFAMASLVLHDVYGPGDWRGKIVDTLVRAALTGAPLDLSPGEQAIDLVHVDDVAAAFAAAAGALAGGGAPACFAVASGRPVTIRALADAVAAAVGRPVHANWGARPYSPDVPMRPGPMPSAPLDWTPAIGLEEGLQSVLREIDG